MPTRRGGHHESIEADTQLALALSPTAFAPGHARAALTAWLAGGAGRGVSADEALLLVSELVTNAVRHAVIGAGDALRLSAHRLPGGIRIAVRDGGTAGTVGRRSLAEMRAADGFGLELVATLARDWGVDRDAGGTTVWLALGRPGPTGAR